MSPNKKKKWLAAMRSGKYKHTRDTLFDGKCHCALGVLADISPAVFEKDKTSAGKIFYRGKLSQARSFGTIHKQERKALGLTVTQTNTIAWINDSTNNYDKVIEYIKVNL